MNLEERRLIEDYLPLDALNAIASKEKLHPRRYVELVHYWPARRPITACRAAIYAALSSAPGDDEERDRAASFVARLASYAPDSQTVSDARARIKREHGGHTPKVQGTPMLVGRRGTATHVDDDDLARPPDSRTLSICGKTGGSMRCISLPNSSSVRSLTC